MGIIPKWPNMSANFRLVNSYSLATNTLMGMIMSIDCLYIYI